MAPLKTPGEANDDDHNVVKGRTNIYVIDVDTDNRYRYKYQQLEESRSHHEVD